MIDTQMQAHLNMTRWKVKMHRLRERFVFLRSKADLLVGSISYSLQCQSYKDSKEKTYLEFHGT